MFSRKKQQNNRTMQSHLKTLEIVYLTRARTRDVCFFGLIFALPHVKESIEKDFIHRTEDKKVGLSPPAQWTRDLASDLVFWWGVILLPSIMTSISGRARTVTLFPVA